MALRKNHSSRSRKKNFIRTRRKWSRRIVSVFTIFFSALFLIGLMIPLRPKTSEVEKRELTKFPSLSISGLMTGSFMDEVTTWYADTFPFREALITGQSKLKALYGLRAEELHGSTGKVADEIPTTASGTAPVLTPAPTVSDNVTSGSSGTDTTDENLKDGTIEEKGEVAGTIYVADDRGFEIFYFSKENSDAYASMINTVKADVGSGVNVYSLIAPSSFGISLTEDVQTSLGGSSEKDSIKYTYSVMNSSVKTIDAFSEIKKHNAEYVYFNTDHHWTQLGAYYAYRAFCAEKGFTPNAIDDYEKTDQGSFLGTYYASSGESAALKSNEDQVYSYTPLSTNDEKIYYNSGKVSDWNIINDASDVSDKYAAAFIGGDLPLVEMDNPKINDGSAVVVIKDSFGNCFVPFLIDHYDKVYVVDYRYYEGSVASLIEENNIEDVLFCNNIVSGVMESTAQKMLALFQ
jgi:hypothetical protein